MIWRKTGKHNVPAQCSKVLCYLWYRCRSLHKRLYIITPIVSKKIQVGWLGWVIARVAHLREQSSFEFLTKVFESFFLGFNLSIPAALLDKSDSRGNGSHVSAIFNMSFKRWKLFFSPLRYSAHWWWMVPLITAMCSPSHGSSIWLCAMINSFHKQLMIQ